MNIILTPQEYAYALSYIENYKHGILIDDRPTGPEDPMVTLLDKAIKLQEEMNTLDEESDDLLLWFINKYHLQEGKPLIR